MTDCTKEPKKETLWNKLCALSHYQLRKKYDMSLWIYKDEAAESAECAHRFTGDSRHHLWKIALFLGTLALFCSVLRCLCSLFCRK